MWNLGILRGKRGEVCDELRKRMIDVCCLHETRWRGQGARVLGMIGRRYKMWFFGKGDGVGGICIILEISSLLSKNYPGLQCACVMDNLIS